MGNYYNNYLINSNCYKKLTLTINNLNNQISNISKLNSSFNHASGNNIDAIKLDLANIRGNLESYINKLKGIKSQLEANANSFDKALNEWISRIGENYSNPVESSPLVLNGDFNNLDYRTKYEIIDDVSVSPNGYINVKVKSFIKSVVKNAAENTSKTNILNESYTTYEHGFDGDYI